MNNLTAEQIAELGLLLAEQAERLRRLFLKARDNGADHLQSMQGIPDIPGIVELRDSIKRAMRIADKALIELDKPRPDTVEVFIAIHAIRRIFDRAAPLAWRMSE
jgi:hypothetical protein